MGRGIVFGSQIHRRGHGNGAGCGTAAIFYDHEILQYRLEERGKQASENYQSAYGIVLALSFAVPGQTGDESIYTRFNRALTSNFFGILDWSIFGQYSVDTGLKQQVSTKYQVLYIRPKVRWFVPRRLPASATVPRGVRGVT
ncbi:hypothetical protein B0H13DRAFT_1911500 [Mycena leptocephala]|nr:hypothetical protein B0H13DRAFT_1911500 [Mycena leptocephala]